MNIFDIKIPDEMSAFDIGDFVSVRNKGKNMYEVIGKDLVDKFLILRPWSKRRPINRGSVLKHPSELKLIRKGKIQ